MGIQKNNLLGDRFLSTGESGSSRIIPKTIALPAFRELELLPGKSRLADEDIADFRKVTLSGNQYFAACSSKGILLDQAGNQVRVDTSSEQELLDTKHRLFQSPEHHAIIEERRPILIPVEMLTYIANELDNELGVAPSQERSQGSQYTVPEDNRESFSDCFDKFKVSYHPDSTSHVVFQASCAANLNPTKPGERFHAMIAQELGLKNSDLPPTAVYDIQRSENGDIVTLQDASGKSTPLHLQRNSTPSKILDKVVHDLREKQIFRTEVLASLSDPSAQNSDATYIGDFEALEERLREPESHTRE